MSNSFGQFLSATNALITTVDTVVDGLAENQREREYPTFNEYFDQVADGADPDVNSWSVVETGGLVTVENANVDAPGYAKCTNAGGVGNDAIFYSKDKKFFALKNGVTSLSMITRVKLNWFDTTAGMTMAFGFVTNDLTPTQADDFSLFANKPATILVSSGLAYACTGQLAQELDLLDTWVADNTYYEFEIKITAVAVEFIIDGITRRTHTTQVPVSIWQMVFASRGVQAQIDILECEYIKIRGT